MKTRYIVSIIIGMSLCLYSCNHDFRDAELEESPISITSPTPTEEISKIALSESQIQYVAASNEFAIKCLKSIYDGRNVVFSPLSLQYALALTSNGASGETADEITKTLGFEKDKEAMNTYYNLLLNQLPAVDKSIGLKLANVVIIDGKFKATNSFCKISETIFYSPIEYSSPSNHRDLVNRINEWAFRNTNGTINPFIEEKHISDMFSMAILNAMYFNAKWGHSPMFLPYKKSSIFFHDLGGNSEVEYMFSSRHFPYCKIEDNGILEIPYGNGNFVMYLILPDTKGGAGITKLLSSLDGKSFSSAIASMSSDDIIYVRMPIFETTCLFESLQNNLESLGISRAFNHTCAEFDNLIEGYGTGDLAIDKVLQKTRIKVNEWGTEASSATMVDIEASDGPEQEINIIDFIADHPFIYIIAEKTSGVILFEGIFNGLE